MVAPHRHMHLGCACRCLVKGNAYDLVSIFRLVQLWLGGDPGEPLPVHRSRPRPQPDQNSSAALQRSLPLSHCFLAVAGMVARSDENALCNLTEVVAALAELFPRVPSHKFLPLVYQMASRLSAKPDAAGFQARAMPPPRSSGSISAALHPLACFDRDHMPGLENYVIFASLRVEGCKSAETLAISCENAQKAVQRTCINTGL